MSEETFEIELYLTEEEIKFLNKLAEEKNITVDQIVNQILEDSLIKTEEKND